MLMHVSDLKLLNSCRRKYSYSSPSRMGLEPKETNVIFFLGKLFHSAEEMYRSPNWTKGFVEAYWANRAIYLNDVDINEVASDLGKFDACVREFEKFLNGKRLNATRLGDNNLDFVSTELSLRHEFRRNQYFGGRLDSIVTTRDTGEYYIFESKTSSNIHFLIESLRYELQPIAYTWLARKNNLPVQGVIYNILSKTPPNPPEILASGKLSKSKSQKTTFELYVEYINLLHPDWSKEDVLKEYGEFLAYLRDDYTYYTRHLVTVTDQQLQIFEDILAHSFSLLDGFMPIPTGRYDPYNNCRKCPFKTPCYLTDNGGEDQAVQLLEKNYKLRTDRTNRPIVIADIFTVFTHADDTYSLLVTDEELLGPFGYTKLVEAIRNEAKDYLKLDTIEKELEMLEKELDV